MKIIVFLTIYFLFLLCQITEVLANENMNVSITPRIINGGNAEMRFHSYTLSLRHRGRYFCTAFPISNRNVLTAGHCFTHNEQLTPPYDDVTVHSDTLSPFELGKIHVIENVLIHPDFDTPWAMNMVHDIAHILLAEGSKLILGANQLKLELPETDVLSGTTGVMTGWGCTDINNPDYPAEWLKTLQMGILDYEDCQRRTNKRLYKEHLCGFGNGGNGCIDGDSGAPLVIEGVAVGIHSWCLFNVCAPGAPEFFTNVFQERSFIYSAMGIDDPLEIKKIAKQAEERKKRSDGSPKKKSWLRRITCTAK